MLRKFLVVAAAIAIPVSAIAITGGAVSGAHAIANGGGPIKCSITSTVTFAPPGLSIAGAVSAGINDLVWFRSFRGELSRVELWCAEPASEVHPQFRGK